MKRRKFITLFCSVAAAWPVGVRAQQSKMPRIGALVLKNEDAEVKNAEGALRSVPIVFTAVSEPLRARGLVLIKFPI